MSSELFDPFLHWNKAEEEKLNKKKLEASQKLAESEYLTAASSDTVVEAYAGVIGSARKVRVLANLTTREVVPVTK